MDKQSKHDTARETFPRLHSHLIDKHAEDIARADDLVHCTGDGERIDDFIRLYGTDTRRRQYKAGEITRDEAARYTLARYTKQRDKELAADLAKLKQVAAADDIGGMVIAVDWRPDHVGDRQARATLTYDTRRIVGQRTTGGNFNKRAHAIADVFRASDEMLKILYRMWEMLGSDVCMLWGTYHGHRLPYYNFGGEVDMYDVLGSMRYTLAGEYHTRDINVYTYVGREA